MFTLRKGLSIAVIVLHAITYRSVGASELSVSEGDFDARNLRPYDLVWSQCSFVDGQWQSQNDLAESLSVLTEDLLRLRQVTSQANGVDIVTTSYFDRSTFAPLRMDTQVIGPNEEPLHTEHRLITNDGYEGFVSRGGELRSVSGKISSAMLSGSALGLPLTTVQHPKSSVRFSASMMSFDATYAVDATWVGEETLSFGGEDITLQMVDIEWHHNESEDIYPAGPNASGGRFWLASNPPPGFPYVPRYVTDTYAVEFVRETCPKP